MSDHSEDNITQPSGGASPVPRFEPEPSPYIEYSGSRWDICGSPTSRKAVIYLTQVFFALVVIIVCALKLFFGEEEERVYYLPLLSSTLAYFLPAPSFST